MDSQAPEERHSPDDVASTRLNTNERAPYKDSAPAGAGFGCQAVGCAGAKGYRNAVAEMGAREQDMNPAEQALVSYLTQIKPYKIGFLELWTDENGWCANLDLDARYNLFTSECIFDDCSDTQARLLLEAFLTNRLSVSWSVSQQLSKLLSKRGRLVKEIMDPLLEKLDWSCCSAEQLFLSYLAVRDDGASWAARLLDEVREDFRDGIFLACFKLKSEELDRKLIKKFIEWEAGHWSAGSTGELHALEQFIGKWLGLYPYADLEGVIRLYFRHRAVD